MRELADALRAALAAPDKLPPHALPRPPVPPPTAARPGPASPAVHRAPTARAHQVISRDQDILPAPLPRTLRSALDRALARAWTAYPKTLMAAGSLLMLVFVYGALPGEVTRWPGSFLRTSLFGVSDWQQMTAEVGLVVQTPRPVQRRQLMTRLPPSIRLTLRGEADALKEVFRNGISPLQANLSSGTQDKLAFEPAMFEVPRDVQVQDIDPQVIQLEWQQIIDRAVPIQGSVTGTLEEGYRVDRIEIDPPSVTVSGPQSLLEVMQFVRLLPFDATGKTEGVYRHRLAFEPIDVRTTLLGPSSATITVAIVPSKRSLK